MNLTTSQLNTLCELAIKAALSAGLYIEKNSEVSVDVNHKKGGNSLASQVVTDVDLASQKLILDILKPSLLEYDLALLTEESDDDGSRLIKDYFWCIDPLDGTLPFIEQRSGYSVSISLVSKTGVPVLGVIYDPTTNTLYNSVDGCGIFRNRKPWNPLDKSKSNHKQFTFVCDRSLLKHEMLEEIKNKINIIAANIGCNCVKIISHGGAAMNACWVLENAPACYLKYPKNEDGGGSLWDYAATASLFREAGAIASDIYGKALNLNNKESTFMNKRGILYATNSASRLEFLVD